MNIRPISRSAGPISLELARKHLKLEVLPGNSPPSHPDDDLLESVYIPAVVRMAEKYTEMAIASAVLELRVPTFGDMLLLPVSPVREIVGVSYMKEDLTVVAANPDVYYLVDNFYRPSIYFTNWPTDAISRPDAVRIQMRVGFDAPGGSPAEEALPEDVQAAMLLHLGHIYENRSSVNIGSIVSKIPLSAEYLLDPYRWRMGL